MRRSISIGLCLLSSMLAAAGASAQTAPAQPGFCGGFGGSGTPEIKPIIYPTLHFDRSDPGFDCQMWQAFIYLNWPALIGERGVPNVNAKFGANGTTVWETYKTVEQVFLPNGQDPGAWKSPLLQSTTADLVPKNLAAQVASGQLRSLTRESKISRQVLAGVAAADVDPTILKEINQVGGGVLYDQHNAPVYYEIGMNEDQYNYIVQNKLYDSLSQNAFAQSNTIALPGGITTYGKIGAIEFKAAWKILTPAEAASGRFHTASAIIPHPGSVPSRVTVGLVGLHVFQMLGASDQGVWATFAQVDNAPVEKATSGVLYSFYDPKCTNCRVNSTLTRPTQVVQIFPDGNTSINDKMQAMIKSYNPKAPWQYYKLVNVQWPQTPVQLSTITAPAKAPLPLGAPNVDTLMNAVLETFLQSKGVNCLGCHSSATVARVEPTAPASKNAASYSFSLGYANPSK